MAVQLATRKWSDAASEIMERAQRMLFSSIGKDAQTYLFESGMNSYTIRHFKLGYMPLVKGQFSQFDFDFFGLDPAQLPKAARDKGGVNVPDGILIPWYDSGQIVKLTVVRPGQTPEYGQIVGSVDSLFNGDSVQSDHPAVMVKSELRALSIWQKAADLVVPIATGTEKKCRTPAVISSLNAARYVLQAFENDEDAWYWFHSLSRCMRWDSWYQPGQEREWTCAGLLSASVKFASDSSEAASI